MENPDELRKLLASLERRAELLEKRFDKLTGKLDAFVPKTSAIHA
jgi:hypothetical protein